jgi:hypothetical protein
MDDSKGFERTDAFVEKSAAVAFDLIRTQALDSAVDLARFLLPRLDPCKKSSNSIRSKRPVFRAAPLSWAVAPGWV